MAADAFRGLTVPTRLWHSPLSFTARLLRCSAVCVPGFCRQSNRERWHRLAERSGRQTQTLHVWEPARRSAVAASQENNLSVGAKPPIKQTAVIKSCYGIRNVSLEGGFLRLGGTKPVLVLQQGSDQLFAQEIFNIPLLLGVEAGA